MRIHSDFIEQIDLQKAAHVSNVGFTRLGLHGSRKRDHAFDVILTGSSPRNQNMGGSDKAATWDEWGVFLGVLFGLDPKMVTPYYADAEHFDWSTGNRYRGGDLPASAQHRSHKWEYAGDAITGSYGMHMCACGAIRRYLHGETWAQFTARHA
jgi:hypothetical protein